MGATTAPTEGLTRLSRPVSEEQGVKDGDGGLFFPSPQVYSTLSLYEEE